MTLNTQANLSESSFYIQREWLEEYEYGKGMFSSEYGVDKNYTSNKMPTAYSCRIIFILFFSLLLILLLSGYEKWLAQSIYDTNTWIKTIVKEATSQGRSEIYIFWESQMLHKCVLQVLKEATEKIAYEYGEFSYSEYINYY